MHLREPSSNLQLPRNGCLQKLEAGRGPGSGEIWTLLDPAKCNVAPLKFQTQGQSYYASTFRPTGLHLPATRTLNLATRRRPVAGGRASGRPERVEPKAWSGNTHVDVVITNTAGVGVCTAEALRDSKNTARQKADGRANRNPCRGMVEATNTRSRWARPLMQWEPGQPKTGAEPLISSLKKRARATFQRPPTVHELQLVKQFHGGWTNK
jgi:hypothetical protein